MKKEMSCNPKSYEKGGVKNIATISKGKAQFIFVKVGLYTSTCAYNIRIKTKKNKPTEQQSGGVQPRYSMSSTSIETLNRNKGM
jgi:hypothetical protein